MVIDAATIEVDGGYGDSPPYKTKAFLRLEGDFVDECERYVDDTNATHLSFEIPRSVAEELHKQLSEVLYG